jgi:glycosyltransferase involved in cell wall biosynthesis
MKQVFVFGTRGFPLIQGGVEKHCEHLYPLIATNFEVTIFRRKPFLKTESLLANYSNIRFIDLFSTQKKGMEAFLHSFIASIYCIYKRPNIIHIHNIGPGLFIPLLKLFRLKVILTYHSPNYEHDKWNKIEKTILKIAEFISLRFADKIIFVNNKQMEHFSRSIHKKSIFIPNGINIKSRIEKPDYILEKGLTPFDYLLSVGRITKEKGFDYLIKCYKSLQLSNIKLVIVGGIDHKSNYSKLCTENNDENIIFTGHIEGNKLQELYSFARLFILPSYNEGHPMVLLEAISYNLPILASNIQANLQLKLPVERYFEVGSVESLKEKIELELKNGVLKINYNNIKLYTWDDICKQTIEVYKYLLS